MLKLFYNVYLKITMSKIRNIKIVGESFNDPPSPTLNFPGALYFTTSPLNVVPQRCFRSAETPFIFLKKRDFWERKSKFLHKISKKPCKFKVFVVLYKSRFGNLYKFPMK